MALNLSKGGEGELKPTEEKKGLNLVKSENSDKVKIDLSKDKPVSSSSLSSSKREVNRKLPILIIFTAVVLLGIAAVWFVNNMENTSVAPVAVENPTSTIVEETATETQTQQPVQFIEIDSNAAGIGEQSISVPGSNEANENTSINSIDINNNVNKVDVPTQNTSSSASISNTNNQLEGSLEEKAIKAMLGRFGNGIDRKIALGDEYSVIQARVNELCKLQN